MKLIDPHIRRAPSQRRTYGMDESMDPVQIAAYRRMTVAQKLDQMAELYRLNRELLAAVIRSRHSDWSDEQVEREVRDHMLYGIS
jgi:ABC-type Na+ transport system ATPase subunit NatA